MNIDHLVAEFKKNEEYGALFGASGASGGNVQSNQGTETSQPVKSKAESSTAERSQYLAKHGKDAYQAWK